MLAVGRAEGSSGLDSPAGPANQVCRTHALSTGDFGNHVVSYVAHIRGIWIFLGILETLKKERRGLGNPRGVKIKQK